MDRRVIGCCVMLMGLLAPLAIGGADVAPRQMTWAGRKIVAVGQLVPLEAPDAPTGAALQWRVVTEPYETDKLRRFELPSNYADRYGTRVRGFVHPPASGEYRFWVSSDDASELWLSSDDSAEHKRRIAHVQRWTSPLAFDAQPTQASEPVALEAGQRYYIELLQKDGDGADHGAVAWSGPGLERTVIDGQYLSPMESGGGEVRGSITRQVWRQISGSRIDDLVNNPRFPNAATARIEQIGGARMRLIPHRPGDYLLEWSAWAEGRMQTGRAQVLAVADLDTVLNSPGHGLLDAERQALLWNLLSGQNIISEAARRRLSSFLEDRRFDELPDDEQRDVIEEFLVTPLIGLLWAAPPPKRAEVEMLEAEPVEFFTHWPERLGPGFSRPVRIEGKTFRINSPQAEMVEVGRAAASLAGLPKPMRDLISTIVIRPESRNELNGGMSTIYIRLSGVPSQQRIDSGIAHEIGHIIDHQFGVKPRWTAVREEDVMPISGYGRRNPDEDFAEFVRFYLSVVNEGGSMEELRRLFPKRTALFEEVLALLLEPPPQTPLEKINAQTTSVVLSDVAPESATVGWAVPLYNRLPDLAANAGSDTGAKFIYAHAPAAHKYRLGGVWKRLQGSCGLQSGHEGSVVFVVKGDDKELFRSDVVRDAERRPLDINLSSVDVLELTVENSGDGGGNDWGIWFEPRLTR